MAHACDKNLEWGYVPRCGLFEHDPLIIRRKVTVAYWTAWIAEKGLDSSCAQIDGNDLVFSAISLIEVIGENHRAVGGNPARPTTVTDLFRISV